MTYEFETDAFSQLGGRFRDYSDPEGIPVDRENLIELANLYISAAKALFRLMQLIMSSRFNNSERGERYQRFLAIYEDRVSALIIQLRDFLLGGIERGKISEVRDFLEGVRRSALANELEALQSAISQSSGEGADAKADAEAGEIVTNSLKEQIERRVSNKWIKDILHAINEVLAIARGVT